MSMFGMRQRQNTDGCWVRRAIKVSHVSVLATTEGRKGRTGEGKLGNKGQGANVMEILGQSMFSCLRALLR